MKKIIVSGIVFSLFLLYGCSKKTEHVTPVVNDEKAVVNEITSTETREDYEESVYKKLDALGYQSEDIMKINYRKSYNDGMSWKERELRYDINDKEITKEKLLSTIWLSDEKVAKNFLLLFYSDDYFIIGGIHSGPSAFGKYTIENGILVLYSFNYDQNVKFYNKLFSYNEIQCELKFESENFKYDNELLVNTIKFYPVGCLKQNGATAVIDGINVIVENDEKVMTDNVKFRKAPSTKAETQVSEIYEEMFWNAPNWKETDCIRKGTVIPIYAKTENSETIDGVTASWYYMSMPTLSDYNLYGWIFGGYFEDYDESRKEEYAEILRKEFE